MIDPLLPPPHHHPAHPEINQHIQHCQELKNHLRESRLQLQLILGRTPCRFKGLSLSRKVFSHLSLLEGARFRLSHAAHLEHSMLNDNEI